MCVLLEKLEKEYAKYRAEGAYFERVAGDTGSFRYPHLDCYAKNFHFDGSCWILERDIKNTIAGIGINEITLYELLNPNAKKLHLYDFLGYTASPEKKYKAYESIKNDYGANSRRGFWEYETNIKEIDINSIQIREEFAQVKEFMALMPSSKIYLCEFLDNQTLFQFGSTLKGTNITFTDSSKSNYGQEIFHSVYHLAEGIKGFNGDNLNITETWGDVPPLYLKQSLEGRLTRRKRQNTSPHDIKFLDYVYSRAYIGQAFIPKTENPYYHSVYALIEPSVKLLMGTFPEKTTGAKNAKLINAICFDKTEEIKKSFDAEYGMGAYEKVYYDFNLFRRLETIDQICAENGINIFSVMQSMFGGSKMVNTILDPKIVAFIWCSKKINQDKELIIDLIEDYSNTEIPKGRSIDIESWIGRAKEKFGAKKAGAIQAEYIANNSKIQNIFNTKEGAK